ncbi:hypothetical protein HA402_011092 [Bradysia odoriphaga]|nr:hypothetical protein HA402_011092 [Bradysia odoriphaga]
MEFSVIRFFYFLSCMTFIHCYLDDGKKLSQSNIKVVATTDDDSHLSNTLAQILKPRVVGTEGHEEVKQFIVNELQSMNVNVELDEFADVAPIFGNLTFTNIVGKLNPNADSYLTLACHYDSKYFPDEYFEAAIDSAVPCAIMLNVLKTLMPALESFRARTDISLMLIFFDGEEAFVDWTQTDSLYGSRHLADMWDSQNHLAQGRTIKPLDRIEVMVLLDLIGAANSNFVNFFSSTQALFSRLSDIERSLLDGNVLDGQPRHMFIRKNSHSTIEDDHTPFMQKGVPILHLIATPFPAQWHTTADNRQNLDAASIRNFNRILRVFVLEYMLAHKDTTSFRS